MKKIIIFLSMYLMMLALPVSAQDKINLYFFYGDGCPHCAKEEKFLDQLEKENKNIKIYRFETWHNTENAQLLSRAGEKMGVNVSGVPFLAIGDQAIIGYYDDKTTGEKIKNLISEYTVTGCVDVLYPLINNVQNNVCTHGCEDGDEECIHNCGCSVDFTKEKKDTAANSVNVPFFGEVDLKNLSLPLLTLVIGSLDGFNPCAMWVLIFLISLLLGMENKKRMWALGLAFIAASGVMYFLFMAAWLNLFLFLGFVFWIRVLIGLVAIASGSYHLYDYYQNRDGGCKVVGSEKKKVFFEKMKKIVGEKVFWVSLVGIIFLAFAVNMVELVCSAGLPAVYTQVLASSNLPTWKYYSYLLFYILFYMLDDIIIFIIAMLTLQIKAVSSRYTKWASLVGGIIILIIGILLIFKPGWIMFG